MNLSYDIKLNYHFFQKFDLHRKVIHLYICILLTLFSIFGTDIPILDLIGSLHCASIDIIVNIKHRTSWIALIQKRKPKSKKYKEH